MSQTTQERANARVFLYIAIASALALIVIFPPTPLVDSLSRNVNVFGNTDTRSIKDQMLIWFTPIFSGRGIVTRLWLAEFAVWDTLSAALFAVGRRREFNLRMATSLLIGAFLVSAAIPTKTIGYHSHFGDDSEVYNHEIVEGESQGHGPMVRWTGLLLMRIGLTIRGPEAQAFQNR